MDDYATTSSDSTRHHHDDNNVNEQHRVLIDFLMNNNEMKKAAKSSLKQGLLAGSGAVAGGLLFGPIGGLVGGVTGSLIGYMNVDNYEGAVQQIIILESTRKQHLIDAVKTALLDAGASANPSAFASTDAFRSTLQEFASQKYVRDQIWKACVDSIKGD
jgi:hypothetical protein